MGTGQGDDVSPVQSVVDSIVAVIRLVTKSIWHFSVVLGIFFILLPILLGLDSVWAGMYPVWGVTFVFVGIAGYLAILALRKWYGQQAASDFLE